MFGKTIFAIFVILLNGISFFNCVEIDPSCDQYQTIELGEEYFIYNVEYPNNYSSATACRWAGESPKGTVIVLTCNDVSIPNSKDCTRDRLVFSPSGDENLQNVRSYCGNTMINEHTDGNLFSLGLFSSGGRPGGKFLCSLAAVKTQENCNCGLKTQRKIVGGQETGIHEYPSMAALKDALNGEVYCGANIISTKYAVTAAHCLYNRNRNTTKLLVGDHDVNRNDDTNMSRLYLLDILISHPFYDAQNHENDIGVVKTRTDMTFNMAVSAVCLPFNYPEYNFQGENVTALGWGYKEFSGDKSSTLQKVDLGVVSNAQCDNLLVEDIQPSQICTYAPQKDACISDSGGPLMWLDRFRMRLQLVGVISYGFGCATSKPAVNTRVTSFLVWIASVTNGSSFCIQ